MKIKNQTVRKYYKYIDIPWTQPLLTGDSGASTSVTTPEGTVYSCNWTRGASYAMSYAFDGIIPTTYAPQCACFVRSTGQSNWVEVYNPNPIKVSQIIIYWSSGSSSTITETINIEASNDGVNYVTLVSGATHSTDATVHPHTIPVNNNNFYNYYKITNTTDNRGYWYVGEIEITATQKTIVESTSSDYDFYEDVNVYKVLQKTVRKYYKYSVSPWTQPALITDGLLGGYCMAVNSSQEPYSTNNVYKAFDSDSSTRWYPSGTGSTGIPIILTIYTPEAIKISNLQFTNYIYGSNAPNAFTIYGSSDNSSFTQLGSFTNTVQAANAIWDVDLSSNTNFYHYYKIDFTQWDGYPTGGRGIVQIDITATQKTIVESTSSDYDFYEDVNAYMAVV